MTIDSQRLKHWAGLYKNFNWRDDDDFFFGEILMKIFLYTVDESKCKGVYMHSILKRRALAQSHLYYKLTNNHSGYFVEEYSKKKTTTGWYRSERKWDTLWKKKLCTTVTAKKIWKLKWTLQTKENNGQECVSSSILYGYN